MFWTRNITAYMFPQSSKYLKAMLSLKLMFNTYAKEINIAVLELYRDSAWLEGIWCQIILAIWLKRAIERKYKRYINKDNKN